MDPVSDVLTENGHPETDVSERAAPRHEAAKTVPVIPEYARLYRWR